MTSSPPPVGGSFRDPSGFVFRDADGTLYRQINQVYAAEYARLMDSGLYADLARRNWIVEHEEGSIDLAQTPDAAHVIRPRTVSFVSYPYEWSFAQLKAAALLTLDIQSRALEHGMSLKDASAYNVQFRGTTPVFIDTLSFETHEQGRPWIAYAQFCRHFLAPLALMSHVDPGLQSLLRAHLDGIPLDMASAMLPWSSKLRLGLLIHLHLHGRAEKRAVLRGPDGAGPPPERKLSARGLRGILSSLRSTAMKLSRPRGGSTWRDYYATNTYSEADADTKRDFVDACLRKIAPGTVWDLGANLGVYSEIARRHAPTVVAMEQDPGCVDAAYRKWAEEDAGILPLVVDLANPSPALGWAHRERDSLTGRGPADAVLALALIHHLRIGNNVPLRDLAAFFASICRHLVIEFVPKDDERVRYLLRAREDVFPDYTRESFEAAFCTRFRIHDSRECTSSGRTLYLMETT